MISRIFPTCNINRYLIPVYVERIGLCRLSYNVSKKDLSHPMENSCAIHDLENGWYEWWESKNFFRRKSDTIKPFVMILPPPNVTGKLHMGHALTCSIQDAIVRWKQMQGHEVVWIPGCDHAGIATQVVVERHLIKTQNISRHQLGREKFLEEVERWKNEKGDIIYRQMRRMGIAIDWKKSTFTMDPKISKAVNKAMEQLFQDGLIYRASMIINWCCSLQSVISDAEVEYRNLEEPTSILVPNHDDPVTFGYIYDIGYQLQNSAEIVVVSTTRPETIFGDTALMVHPDDQRFSHLHGKYVRHPYSDNLMPIITDSEVNMELGTGVVKVTPCNSFEDYEIGKRHNLQMLEFMDDNGFITGYQVVKDLPRFKAREWVLKNLASRGLYQGKKVHPMQLPTCSRTGDVIEPRLKNQWFIKMKNLSEAAMKAVQEGNMILQPDQYKKVWELFLSANRDWCISRQLWWGHRLPLYWTSTKNYSFYGNEDEIKGGTSLFVVASSDQDALEKGASKLGVKPADIKFIAQDQDVLDTWFSSGLLPFAVFGWPQNTDEYTKYYPLSLLETGHDIIFFWVARMVMLGIQLTKQLPFKEVLLHSIVCDEQRHKMSKSKGNTIDPMDIMDGCEENLAGKSTKKIPVCGSDALRFSLCSYDIKNWLISLDMRTIEQNNLFRNKIWQTIRFLIQNVEKIPDGNQHMKIIDKDSVNNAMDAWLLSKMSEMVTIANRGFDSYDLHEATRALKTFWYTHLCDVYLEAVKPRLWNSNDLEKAHTALSVLYTSCHTALLVLSPFMPFLSEELYQRLPSFETKCDSIMECEAPRYDQWKEYRNLKLEENISDLVAATSALRNLRKTFDIKSKGAGSGTIFIKNLELIDVADSLKIELARMSFLSEVAISQFIELGSQTGSAINHVCPGISVQLHLQGLIEPEKERTRITNQLHNLAKQKQKMELKILRPHTSSLEVGDKNKKKLEAIEERMHQYQKLLQNLDNLS